jgi:hypothetical protein
MAPSAIHSVSSRVDSLDGLFTGRDVATFISRAVAAMRRASGMECDIGFWHSTCFLLRIAAMEIGACQ